MSNLNNKIQLNCEFTEHRLSFQCCSHRIEKRRERGKRNARADRQLTASSPGKLFIAGRELRRMMTAVEKWPRGEAESNPRRGR